MPETENKCRNYHNEWINRYLRELIKTGISRKNTEKIQFSFFLSPVLLFPIWIVAIIRGEDIQKFTKKGGIRNNREATFLLLSSLSSHYQLDTNSKYKISYIAEYGNAQGNKQLFYKRFFLPHMIIIERSTHDAEQGSNQPT